jgi:protein kinase A
MAPELVKKEPYGFSVDYWSLGICIFEMLVGKVPFNDEDPIKVYEKIIEGKVYFTKKMDERAKSLLKILLIYD